MYYNLEHAQLLRNMFCATRLSGSTTWLIESVLKNPRVVVVSMSGCHAEIVRRMYQKAISEMPWYKKTLRRFTKKHTPLFIGLSQIYRIIGIQQTPVVFDNSVLAEL